MNTIKLLPDLLISQIAAGEVVEDASTLSSTIQGHHQARLLRRAPKTRQAEAEGAVPAPRNTQLFADMLDLRLPNQRTVSEDAGH